MGERLKAFFRQPPRKVVAFGVTCGVGALLAIVVFSYGDREDRQPGKTVFDFVAHLPTSIWLYVAVVLIALLGWVAHRCRLGKFESTIASFGS